MSGGGSPTGGPSSDESAWAAPKHTKAPQGETEEENYELDEQDVPRAPVKAVQTASKGSQAFDSVKNGARNTLKGLRAWQSAAQWGTLGEFLALIAALLLVVQIGLGFAGIIIPGTIGFVGSVLGVATLVMWLWAFFHFMRGIRFARLGRDELGYLQRREVDAAMGGILRGGLAMFVAAIAAVMLALQADTFASSGRMENAAIIALGIAAFAAVLGVLPFARGVAGMLRNLTPNAGKRGRRRLVLTLHIWAVPAIAVYLVGAGMGMTDYGVACQELGGCQASQLMPVISPPFSAPAKMLGEPPAASYLELPLMGAAILLLSRLAGYRGLRMLRDQLGEADRFLVYHVAARMSAVAPASLAI